MLAEQSVLCWLATSDKDGQPSVSPKEAFVCHDNIFLIANIVSPQSARNVTENEKVCLSFLEIFTQKGYKIYGEARLIKEGDDEFEQYQAPLLEMTKGLYPFNSLFMIEPQKIQTITAPSYFLFKDTTEESQARKAFALYSKVFESL